MAPPASSRAAVVKIPETRCGAARVWEMWLLG
jgi:hypothetical protein